MKRYCYLLPALLFCVSARAQPNPAVALPSATTRPWQLGLGVGNGVAVQGAYRAPHWLALGRIRGKWWGPESELKTSFFGDDTNTRSSQSEVALLLGYPLTAGGSYFHAAAGVAYVSGRQLGAYRYSLRKSGLISADAMHYYAYRDYRAVGLPLEVGWQLPIPDGTAQFGLVGQANLNPQQSVYCLLVNITLLFPSPQRPDL